METYTKGTKIRVTGQSSGSCTATVVGSGAALVILTDAPGSVFILRLGTDGQWLYRGIPVTVSKMDSDFHQRLMDLEQKTRNFGI